MVNEVDCALALPVYSVLFRMKVHGVLLALLLPLILSAPAPAQTVIDVWELSKASTCDPTGAMSAFRACVSAARDSTYAELEEVYREAMVASRQAAAANPERLASLPSVLERSQRSWETFRDVECDEAVWTMVAPGNMSSAVAAQCEIAKARVRIAELRIYYLESYFSPSYH